MKNESFKELEEYIYKLNKEESLAVSTVADIVGVLVGAKPAAFIVAPNEMERNELEELFSKNNIKSVFLYREDTFNGKVKYVTDVFISKDLNIAVMLSENFRELWSTMDNLGEILNYDKWKECSYKIGRLLGYPETAIKYYVERNEDEINKEENVMRMRRNRYYAHSAKNEEKEFLEYDLPLNQAIEQWSPRTAEIMRHNIGKRWK